MPDSEPDEPTQYLLDARSFNSAERLECQVRFDATFGDLLWAITEAIDPAREVMTTRPVVARDGTRWFPDQIIQYMLWVQVRRDRPDATLEEFDDLVLRDLNSAHLRGLMGKGGGHEASEIVARARLVRFLDGGLTWVESGRLPWGEFEALVELMETTEKAEADGRQNQQG